jgi:pseudaminic acid synthase
MSKDFKINERVIGKDFPCYIIAEMSANHAGDFNRALEIVHAAKDAGADCIKIQTYTADTLTIDCDNEYFNINSGLWKGENLYSLYKKAFTPWEWQARLKEEADRIGIDFLSTPFDKTAVDFLEEIGVSSYKIASFELVDIPLLKYTAQKNKPIIMSTGMGRLSDIEQAINTITETGNQQICLLKCLSAYPAVPEDMNLATIKNMCETFGYPTGLSDHTTGSVSAVTAVAMGACVVEKHFCLSRNDDSPDSAFSLEPEEFGKMVQDIRLAEKMIGGIRYAPSPSEKINQKFRKSIFVVKDIKAGEALTSENIRVIRPGYGLAPVNFEELLGKHARTEIKRGTPISWSLVE